MAKVKSEPKPASKYPAKHSETLAELENYKLLVDSVQDYAIFVLDPEGYIVSWNKGAERNKGYKAHEIIGKHFSTFYTPYDIEARKPERELEIAKRLGRIEDEDWRVRKDGSRFWANVIITALYNKDGILVGFGKVTRDLTERKRQEDELRKANTILRRQQEELRRLNESKDEFISLASHQLRTPATIVKQLLGVLLAGFQGGLTDEQLYTIKKAEESNERQIAIINSLLEVARLDAGKVTLRKEPTNISRLLSDVVDEQLGVITERQQAVNVQLSDDRCEIAVDPKYFRMVVENLVDNASKYTHDQGNIVVACEEKDGQVCVSVGDNGIGMSDDNLQHLFTKFARFPNELSRQATGSGLGLYWVKRIVELHGGTIAVESKQDAGTTFVVSVPKAASDA